MGETLRPQALRPYKVIVIRGKCIIFSHYFAMPQKMLQSPLRAPLTFSCVMLKNDQTYSKNLVLFTPQDF